MTTWSRREGEEGGRAVRRDAGQWEGERGRRRVGEGVEEEEERVEIVRRREVVRSSAIFWFCWEM